MRNKGFKFTAGAFLLMFIGDLISTLINGDLVKHLEANPLYPYGGLWLIGALNLAVPFAFYYLYNRSGNAGVRHTYIFGLVLVSFYRVFIIYNNVQAFLNPVSLEEAAAIPREVKTQFYLLRVVLPLLIAWVPPYLAFWLFKKDHDIYKKHENKVVLK